MTVWVQDPYSQPKPVLSGTSIYIRENSNHVKFELTEMLGLISGTYFNATVTVDTQGRIIAISSGTGGGGGLGTGTQAPNYIYAGPPTGTTDAVPTFRPMVYDDLPDSLFARIWMGL